MEFCWALPVVPTDQYQELYRAYTDQALRAEKIILMVYLFLALQPQLIPLLHQLRLD
ncbi:hypothetical protein ACLMAB_04015 [Brevibacillus laterosporus]